MTYPNDSIIWGNRLLHFSTFPDTLQQQQIYIYMKITVQTDNLQKKLSIANRAISTKTDLPILQHMFLDARGDKVTIRATDLEIGIETYLPAEIHEEGSVLLPAKTFSELINSFPQESITLETTEKGLVVISKRSKSVFQTLSSEEFPRLFEEKGTVLAELASKDLKSDFGCVIFSASTESTRPALSGVLVRKEGSEGFLLVATDGYRLSLKHTTTGQQTSVDDTNAETGLILPAKVFREVLGLKEVGEKIKVFIAKQSNQIMFEYGETLIIGRLIEAEFPAYERIIPSDFSLVVSFDREELLKAVKICAIFARDTANIIKLSFKENGILVSSSASSVGENEVQVEAVLKGEENEIAFNAKYLLDALSNIDKNELTFEMMGPLNPGVFKVKDDASFLHLIMPIKVQG